MENKEDLNEQNNEIEKTHQDNNEFGDEITLGKNESWFYRTRNIIYYILGVIEILLLFRLVFRSLGANIRNELVVSLYSVTKLLIAPFVGIFNIITPAGTTQYVIEPATILAMIVYAIIAYGIVRLIKVTALSV